MAVGSAGKLVQSFHEAGGGDREEVHLVPADLLAGL